jgi:hypothetical protein
VLNEESEEGRVSSDERREAKKNMKKKVTFLALCTMLFALCVSAQAQQPTKVSRIGYLSNSDAALTPPAPREFGWRCASWAT